MSANRDIAKFRVPLEITIWSAGETEKINRPALIFMLTPHAFRKQTESKVAIRNCCRAGVLIAVPASLVDIVEVGVRIVVHVR